jgi:5-methylcytosine-specific restriction protein A
MHDVGRLTGLPSRLGRLSAKVKPAPKVAESFYQSPEWRRLVASIKRQRGNWCERCGSTNRVIADHIHERKDGGADLDSSNIELLCAKHHAAKTAAARATRARGGGQKSGKA